MWKGRETAHELKDNTSSVKHGGSNAMAQACMTNLTELHSAKYPTKATQELLKAKKLGYSSMSESVT